MTADTKTRDRIAFALFHESYVGEQGDVIYSRTRWNELQGSELEYWLHKGNIAMAAIAGEAKPIVPAKPPREIVAMGLFQVSVKETVNMDAAASAAFWDVCRETNASGLGFWYHSADAAIATVLASK